MGATACQAEGIRNIMRQSIHVVGTLSKKNQPDYKLAMKAERAQTMYNQFLDMLKEGYMKERILDGKFGEMMDVGLVNDGPVTLVIDSRLVESEISPLAGEDNNKGNI